MKRFRPDRLGVAALVVVVTIEVVCVVSFAFTVHDAVTGTVGAYPAAALLGAAMLVYVLWGVLIVISMFD